MKDPMENPTITPQELQDFVNRLSQIEVSGDRTQKQLEAAILILENIAWLAARRKIIIMEKI